LLSNPEKYENILMKEKEFDPYYDDVGDPGRWEEKYRGRKENRDYWHKMINDVGGKNEDFPMRQEFFMYKLWYDKIQYKALDTLKFTV
jgi:hypothetical protein